MKESNQIGAYYVGGVNLFDVKTKKKLLIVLEDYRNRGPLVTLVFCMKGILHFFKILFYNPIVYI